MTDPERADGRRGFLLAGAVSAAAGLLAALAAAVRMAFPGVLYEAEARFPVGRPEDFPPDTATYVPERRLFVVRSRDGFHVVSSVCTHLGCNVGRRHRGGLICPCHGSVFDGEGHPVGGPARSPLARYRVSLSRRGELVVHRREPVPADFRLEV